MILNKHRRSLLMDAYKYLDAAYNIVDRVLDDESDALDNIPENLLGGDAAEKIENTISLLEDIAEDISTAKSNLIEAKS